MTSQTGGNRWGRAESLGFALFYGALTALPICGLVLFFAITRPAQVLTAGSAPGELASLDERYTAAPDAPLRKNAVARLTGVSAELGEARLFTANDAALAFGGAPRALKAGVKTEFVTKDHRRIAVRIIRRDPITDQAAPDNARLMGIIPASSASTVSFVWGSWLYVAEVEDKGTEPDIAVQEVL